jgi:hypothetical protein
MLHRGHHRRDCTGGGEMSDELKPCPFCENIPFVDTLDDVGGEYSGITCEKCQRVYMTSNDAKKPPIKLWNTRPIEDALTAEVARLRKALVFVRSCLDENNDDAIDRIDAALRGEQ